MSRRGALGRIGGPCQPALNEPCEASIFLREDLAAKTVCFTGDLACQIDGKPLTRERAEALADAAGLIPMSGVTKKLDILVVADPDTRSGKAKKAREYELRLASHFD